ncbi:M4 family metallopeptidase [Streptomyces sp. NPDC047841]|uniref:M4 family metallopeptidase n=1 Tax=Streptomyces sp. NPDC047841 TaxID=3154708 RepID=UPI003451C49D
MPYSTRALTQYLAPTSTFTDAMTAMVTAASDLYGASSRQASVTSNVWTNEVGIEPSTPDPRPTACAGGITTGPQQGSTDKGRPRCAPRRALARVHAVPPDHHRGLPP